MHGTVVALEQPELFAQTVAQLMDVQARHPRSGKLDGERDAVQVAANVDGRADVVFGYGEVRVVCRGARNKESNRAEPQRIVGFRLLDRWRNASDGKL